MKLLDLIFNIFRKNDFSEKDSTKTKGDDKNFNTIEVGKQIWMAKNLDDRSIKDSYQIEEISHNVGSYYNPDSASKASPNGWRIPNVEDWKALTNILCKGSGKEVKDIENRNLLNLIPGGLIDMNIGNSYEPKVCHFLTSPSSTNGTWSVMSYHSAYNEFYKTSYKPGSYYNVRLIKK